jgi:hypothetical protein
MSIERKQMKPTNNDKFPDGKLTDNDMGALQIEIGVYEGRVIVAFNHEVGWLGMLPGEAKVIGETLIKYAKEAMN